MSAFKPLVFSGVQPTGNLHLGNYLGAIRKFVALQEDNDCIYCVVDLHALTAQLVHEDMRNQIRSIAAAFIASGIDPKKHIVFNQSAVPQHSELAWIFNCVARIGWMERMTQFKDKAGGKNAEQVSLGLLAYPSLMAADILVYRATHVPVGDDQKQHLELARDIATKFNLDTGTETFTLPDPTIPPTAARIMSLRDGNAKMSKSDPSDMSRINLVDAPDTIMAKIRKARTDAEPLPSEVAGLQDRPEAKNLVSIYAAMADESIDDVLSRFAGQGFGSFKPALGELLVETLRPIATRLNQLKADPAAIDAALEAGAARAAALARPTLDAAYSALGLCR